MAGYDASIRVNTKVDNSDLREAQKEVDTLTRKLENLRARSAKLEMLGGTEKQFESLGYDAEILEDKLAAASARLEELKKVSGVSDGFEKVEKSSKKLFKTIQSGTKKSNSLLSTFSSRLKGIALSLLVFNWITKGFNAMVNAMKEGFHNLAQYSDEYNASMSALKSQTEQLKNGLAAAFEPIVNMAIPYITQLVYWLNTAADSMAQFLAALQGKSTYTRAKKQVLDYAKSLDTASKSAKGALASFDQLNVLSKNNDTSSSGATTGANAFETAEVESKIALIGDKVNQVIAPLKDSLNNWFTNINFQPLIDSFEGLKKSLEPITNAIGNGLIWLLENVFEPIGSFVFEDALPHFFDMLASAVDACVKVFEVFKPAIEYIWKNVLEPMGKFIGEAFLGVIDAISYAIEQFGELFKEKSDEIQKILEVVAKAIELIWIVGKTTIQLILGALKPFIDAVVNIIKHVIDVLSGLIDFVVGVFTGDWEKAWEGIKDVFKGIWNILVDIVEGALNMIIGGLNNISFDVPDWIPGIGGKHVGFDIEEVSWPRLAKGAVIQGGKPFAAILGDQRYGQTNIEAPLATIQEALQNVMDQNGGNGEINLTVNLDGEIVYKDVVRRDMVYRKQTGNSAFIY